MLLQKINEKIRLRVPENILLASYLHKIDFSEEQIIDVYKKAVNYDAGKTKYNVKYIQNKDLTPFNCDKIQGFGGCHADDICRGTHISNPLNYRGKK